VRKVFRWCVAAQTHVFGRMTLGRSGLAPTAGGLGSDDCVNLLVGGEPDEPVDAAGAGQALELVLASVF
jgi:hypothetical protein